VRTIHHVVDVDTDAAAVWRALTEPESLASWWSTALAGPAAAVGVEQRWTFGGDFNPVMLVTACEAPHRLGWRCTDGHPNWQDNDFVFELVPLDDGRTRLRFWQNYATELSDDDYGTYNFNWGYYLESLRRLCTTGVGTPYQAS
jgi:uncharacterized protein YndB with AHSA1/START domain